jgi:hypothetical protein
VSKSVSKVVRNSSENVTDRREMLKQLGRFGGYTAPVMIAAFATSKAACASTGEENNAKY